MTTKVEQTKPKTNAIQTFRTGLVKTQETFINMLQKNGEQMALKYDSYQISCARNMLSKMVELLWKENLTIHQINQNNITDILQTTAMLRLNPSAIPREVYVILRNVKIGNTSQKVFEMGIEGDGNDKILREYGVGVKRVHNPWLVRENDEFTYPSFKGLEVVPPSWTPKDYHSKVVRVVYPIEMDNGTVEYHISERESVVTNLQAHISNNLMWEKDAKKLAIKDKIADMSLEQILADKDAMAIASPAWRGAHSKEAMIVRKMRNNATKKIPKDFNNSFVKEEYEKTYEDYDQYRANPEDVVDAEFEESAGQEVVEIEMIAPQDDPEEQLVEEVIEEPVKKEEPKKQKRPF